MDKNKSKLLLIILGCIVIIIFGFLIYNNLSSNAKLTINNTGSNNSIGNTTNNTLGDEDAENPSDDEDLEDEEEIIIIPLELVDNYQMFFEINDIINDYYDSFIYNDKDAIIDKLSSEYLKDKKITKDNVMDLIKGNFTDIAFISKKVYRKGINNTHYFFVEGERQDYTFSSMGTLSKDTYMFGIIVDNDNNRYEIIPIEDVKNLYLYANSYQMEEKTVKPNANNIIDSIDYIDELVTRYYINYYKNLLYLDSEKAYNMLSSESKQKYYSLQVFVNDLSNIYSKLTGNFITFGVNGKDGERVYSVENTDQTHTILTESSIMNFTVTIN